MNRKIILLAGVLSALAGLPAAMAQQDQAPLEALIAEADGAQGEQIARACRNCHSLSLGESHRIGPNLYGVTGRRVAGAAGFSYSDALVAKIGETWTDENLSGFLKSPRTWAPGTKMSFPGLPNDRERAAVIAYLRSLPDRAAGEAGPGSTAAADGQTVKIEAPQQLVREGLVIDFSVTPAPDRQDTLREGDIAEVAFRITDEATGGPVSGLFPGAWMDIAAPWGDSRKPDRSCKDRVGLYLQGNVGIRPLIDMNNYFLMSLNEDATITVIDPFVGISGITKLYGLIKLKRPGADWAKTADDKRFFVSMPRADQVAVVNTDNFKVEKNVDAGVHPVRVAVQPDEKYLWVGNDSKEPAESGVTVIEIGTWETVARIPTGAGHHEIAFSDDSRTAFVSNRTGGTVTVIDVQSLQKVADIETGATPISLAYSPLSKALYVADGIEGSISVIDGRSHEVVATIQAMPGLGPLRFEATGRWGLVSNSELVLVHVIDASANRIAQDVSVGTRPFQVTFSRAFAYVRSLGTERVSMFSLDDLNKGRKPAVVSFQAGQKAPELTPELNLAEVIVEAPGMAAVLVASPADATVYYYMEGMNAPMANFRNYGHRPLAVGVVDRALREKAPGVYAANVRLPEAGTYEIAFMMDSPQILHCFAAVAQPDPALQGSRDRVDVEYLVESRQVPAGEEFGLRFLLSDSRTGQLRSGLEDVRVLFFRAPNYDRTEVLAKEVTEGIYEARLPIRRRGAYFVYVGSASAKVAYGELPFLTLSGVPSKAATNQTGQSGG
jgi:YVTN family beta-propeller protein